MSVSNQHLFETIRHGHAICLDRINPDSHILNGFWSRDQMGVVLARVRELEAALALYAKEDNWSHDYYEDWRNGANVWTPNPDHSDDVNGPDVARAALAGERE